jgi:DNA adenine methylase
MQYMGGKQRHAKQIISAMREYLQADLKHFDFYEPFCGGAGMTVFAADAFRCVYSSDSNEFMIAIFRACQKGWRPPTKVSEKTYKRARELSRDGKKKSLEEMARLGFIGAGCSFGGKFFCGYARDNRGSNYALQSVRWLRKYEAQLLRVKFHCADYRSVKVPKGAVLYCDPPYENTTGYKGQKFSHAEFWLWAERQARRGVHVFVSSYVAPAQWRAVWGKTVFHNTDARGPTSYRVEKLFVFEA